MGTCGENTAIAAAGTVMNGADDGMLRSFHAATLVGAALCALSAMLAIFAIPRRSQP